MAEYIDNIDIFLDDYLRHEGVSKRDGAPIGSGRYPLGSGENPYQHDLSLLSDIRRYRAQGFSDKEIAEKCNILKYGKPSAKELKKRYSVLQEQEKTALIVEARRLADEGLGPSEIGRRIGKPPSTVAGYLKDDMTQRMSKNMKAATMLKELADEKKYVDVSKGSELYLDMTRNRMENALAYLESEGYTLNYVKIPQLGTNHSTTVSVLAPPGVSYAEIIENRFNIQPVFNETRVFNQDGELSGLGLTRDRIHSISADRVQIKYNEEGGVDCDGLIELRRGVDDISIGSSAYAQVRIPVNDSYYIKGMAVYSDDLPPGVDVRFNTNKHLGTPMMDDDKGVLKPMKKLEDGSVDWENPFGASIKVDAQLEYTDANGKRQYSACNIVNKAGEWADWDRNVPSQLGSKQPMKLISRQLELDLAQRQKEFEEINSLTNPTIKKQLLIEYGDGCDTAASELKAAPFPGQQTHVLLPSPKIKEGEIYAPNYTDGTKVALVRFPHAGQFEIPVLTVNNKNQTARKMIGTNQTAPDAVVINHTTAEQLSGADFDGDTAIVIPFSDKVTIKSQPRLRQLIGFDPSEAYPAYDGMKVIAPQTKQTEMGKVTNLITDMSFQNAAPDEIARAVKHSMVIIDSEKHKLDYKRSEKENGIAELKKIYQDDGHGHTGAGTLISRAGAEVDVPALKDWRPQNNTIDPETGLKIRTPTGETYTKVKLNGVKERDPETGKMKTVYPSEADAHGWIGTYSEKSTGRLYYMKTDPTTQKKVRQYLTENDYTNSKKELRTTKVTRMSQYNDAYELTSGGSRENPGNPIEKVYAEYANGCKALANQARLTWLNTKDYKKDPAASKEYEAEVRSLNQKLKDAQKYAPLERQAQMIANRTMARKRAEHPEMSKDREKKYKSQAINSARNQLGVHRKDTLVSITDREWEAIQHKAVSSTTLRAIIANTDSDKLKERAMPRVKPAISDASKRVAKAMAATGFTNAQIADRLGISTGSVSTILNE